MVDASDVGNENEADYGLTRTLRCGMRSPLSQRWISGLPWS